MTSTIADFVTEPPPVVVQAIVNVDWAFDTVAVCSPVNGGEDRIIGNPGPVGSEEIVQLAICDSGDALHEMTELPPPEIQDGFALMEAVTEMTVMVVASVRSS